MKTEEKIPLILEEYRTLRTEILQRNTSLNNVFTVAGTVGAGAIGLMVEKSAYIAGSIVVMLIAILIGFAWLLVDHDSRAASSRIQEIEAYINNAAGEQLLVWERDHGLDAVGYGARANSALNKIKKFLSSFGRR